MDERKFHGKADRLRAPSRLALLEVDRVVTDSMDGLNPGSVLDVGTGSGVFAEAFAGRGLAVSGIDASPEMVEAARRHVPQASFRQGVAEAIPFADQSFDLVFLGLVLHETDNAVQALVEAGRVARKRVVVLEWPYRQQEMGPPLAHRLAPARVVRLARDAGFAEVDTVQLAHVVLFRLSWGAERATPVR